MFTRRLRRDGIIFLVNMKKTLKSMEFSKVTNTFLYISGACASSLSFYFRLFVNAIFYEVCWLIRWFKYSQTAMAIGTAVQSLIQQTGEEWDPAYNPWFTRHISTCPVQPLRPVRVITWFLFHIFLMFICIEVHNVLTIFKVMWVGSQRFLGINLYSGELMGLAHGHLLNFGLLD